MTVRYYRNGPATSLAVGVDAFSTTIDVDQASGFPTQTPYRIIVDKDTVLEEIMLVTGVVGTTLTVTRGDDNATASAHAAGAVVVHGVTAGDHAEANSHVNATTNVHGATGALVDTGSAQSISGDKTFTGLLATSGGAVVALGGEQTITGRKIFSDLETSAGGDVMALGGTQTVTGNKTYTGTETHQGAETHSGLATFSGDVAIGGANITGPWVDYTPVRRNGSGGSTLAAGTGGSDTGAYKVIGGKTCLFWARIEFGTGAGIGTTDYHITLPFPSHATRWRASGIAYLWDDSANKEFMKAWRIASSTATGRQEAVVFAENGDRISGAGGGSPLAWADGDEIFIFGSLELV